MANITGTGGNDILRGTQEDDRLWGLAGNDDLDGGEGDDLLYGEAGDDLLTSASGYDRLDGGEADDRLVLVGTGGAVTGGVGFDTLVVNLSTASAAVTFNGESRHGILSAGTAGEAHIYFRDVERLELTTGSGADWILGAAGNDVIASGAGNDVIGPYLRPDNGTSMLGDDYIDAGAGFDFIVDTVGANRIYGGGSDDVITTTLASAVVDGGSGFDRLYLSDDGGDDLTVDFVQGTASTGTALIGFESTSIEFGSGDDTIIATNLYTSTLRAGEGNNHVEGSGGLDYMVSGSGDDVMIGGDGTDTIISLGGADLLIGGDGNDNISDASANLSDGFTTIDAGAGDDTILAYYPEGSVDGGTGTDTLNISAYAAANALDFDAAAGTWGTSLTFSNVENFRVIGSYVDDVLRGADGVDFFEGIDGDDMLDGRGGNDELYGGSGADIMTGGAGADTFRYWSDTYSGTGIDEITDFDTAGGDVLRIIGPATTMTGIDSFAALLAASTQTGDDVYVAFRGSDSYGILLKDVLLSDLSAEDVIFT
jgi:Ca2+-binding RTX toxin-like protein